MRVVPPAETFHAAATVIDALLLAITVLSAASGGSGPQVVGGIADGGHFLAEEIPGAFEAGQQSWPQLFIHTLLADGFESASVLAPRYVVENSAGERRTVEYPIILQRSALRSSEPVPVLDCVRIERPYDELQRHGTLVWLSHAETREAWSAGRTPIEARNYYSVLARRKLQMMTSAQSPAAGK